jgi:hypothetical protein
MLRHVVMFRWKEGVGDEEKRSVAEGLGALPAAIPEIRRYEFGEDAGLSEGSFDFVLVADFETQVDYEVYQGHPDHQQVIRERIKPAISERAAAQYWF